MSGFRWRARALVLALTLLSWISPVTARDFNLLVLDGKALKWGEAAFGTPADITYAFATHDSRDPAARNCSGVGDIAGLAADAGAPLPEVEDEAAKAFSLWQAVAGVRFHRVDDEARADILIGMQLDPVGYAFTNVSYQGDAEDVASREHSQNRGLNQPVAASIPASAPVSDGGIASLRRALICFNPKRGWKVGFGGNPKAYDIRYTLIHEIGHAIGLDHVPGKKVIMNFEYSEAFREPQAGDVAGALRLYGPPSSEN